MNSIVMGLNSIVSLAATTTDVPLRDNDIFQLSPQLLMDSLLLMVAVIVLFFLLSYLLFNPARDLLKKRREFVQSQLADAEKDKISAREFKREYDGKLKVVDKEAEEILSEARKKAMKRENEIINEAKSEAALILQRANKEVELEKSKVKDDVKQEMISVASAMAGKFVAASLDEGKQQQLINEALEEMGDGTWQN